MSGMVRTFAEFWFATPDKVEGFDLSEVEKFRTWKPEDKTSLTTVVKEVAPEGTAGQSGLINRVVMMIEKAVGEDPNCDLITVLDGNSRYDHAYDAHAKIYAADVCGWVDPKAVVDPDPDPDPDTDTDTDTDSNTDSNINIDPEPGPNPDTRARSGAKVRPIQRRVVGSDGEGARQPQPTVVTTPGGGNTITFSPVIKNVINFPDYVRQPAAREPDRPRRSNREDDSRLRDQQPSPRQPEKKGVPFWAKVLVTTGVMGFLAIDTVFLSAIGGMIYFFFFRP